ncbi:MAG: YSC84-related protein [Candidatus Korobacteraceae bacterium]
MPELRWAARRWGSDDDANKGFYGKPVDASQIIKEGVVPVPAAGKPLIGLLDKTSPKRM